MQTGYCTSCPTGYLLYNNACWNLVFPNKYCQVFTDTTCTTCYNRYYLHNGICTAVNSNCVTYDMNTGACLTCNTAGGYTLQGTLCVKSSNCLTTTSSGACKTCPTGFAVYNGLCIDVTTINPYCLTWSGSTCTACQDGYYFGSNGICIALASVCGTYNVNTGACTSCPSGYVLFNGVCWSLSMPTPPNPFCSYFNGIFCTNCYPGYYLAAGVCIPANPYCLTYNMIGGACLTCPPGYYLSGIYCYVSDPNCATWNMNGTCTACYNGFVLWGVTCIGQNTINPWCETWVGTTCTWCYYGYYLGSGICIPANPYCNGYNMNTGACYDCYPGYYLSGALCLASNPNCQTVAPQTGYCTSCYTGYLLWGNSCVA